jgi:hypothetical protein
MYYSDGIGHGISELMAPTQTASNQPTNPKRSLHIPSRLLKIKPQDFNVRLTTALGAKAATDEAERANRRTLIVA